MSIMNVLQTNLLGKHLNQCKDMCKSSYSKLSSKEKHHVDALMETVIQFYRMALPYVPKAVEYAQTLSVENVIAFLKVATKVMQKKETVQLIQHYIAMYGDSLKNPKRLKAYGAYLRCVLAHLDAKYKKIVTAAIDFAFAFICLIVTKEVRAYVHEVAASVNKYVVKPLHRDVRRK